jgi:hypothetical protein
MFYLFPKTKSSWIFTIVILTSLIIAISLIIATWDINFWPTDAEIYYFDIALQLPHYKYLSEMHKPMEAENLLWLHGKEILILCISLMQRFMNDFSTLRPFMMVGILSTCFSGILVFLIFGAVWGVAVGAWCYFLYATSFWPYLYVLFAKHQPLGLVFCLFAIYCLLSILRIRKGWWFLSFLSGMSLSFAVFSSTSASLYLPFYVAGFFYVIFSLFRQGRKRAQITLHAMGSGFLILAGFLSNIVYVSWPDVLKNIKGYWQYIQTSSSHTHFFYNQAYLQQWFLTRPVADLRAGWLWVLKYFLVAMPVLFPLYLLGIIFLLCMIPPMRSRTFTVRTLGVIGLSFTPPLLAEAAHVAQYGGNYFPALLGIILLLGYVGHVVITAIWPKRKVRRIRQSAILAIVMLGVLQVVINGQVFFSDIYPTRFATTFLSRRIESLGIDHIYSYQKHPYSENFLPCLSPKLVKNLEFVSIQNIMEPKKGYILVPPATGDAIYNAAKGRYADFDDDVFLNELRRKGNLKDYAVASFRTLANSRIWLHEEEILSYRDLILGHKFYQRDEAGRVWLLDAGKLRADFLNNIPRREYQELSRNQLRNIGTKTKIYIFLGSYIYCKEPRTLQELYVWLSKVGNPQDSLQAYIYKGAAGERTWVPAGDSFISQPLLAREVPFAGEDRPVVFRFQPPLQLDRGMHFFVIYRTGEPNDEQHYRILADVNKVFYK